MAFIRLEKLQKPLLERKVQVEEESRENRKPGTEKAMTTHNLIQILLGHRLLTATGSTT
jgi:hypothetical protein